MNTIRVIENKTNRVLAEEVVFGMTKFFNGAETLRHNWDGKVDGGCTIKGYYTTPNNITEDTKAVINNKTWDCM